MSHVQIREGEGIQLFLNIRKIDRENRSRQLNVLALNTCVRSCSGQSSPIAVISWSLSPGGVSARRH